MFRLRKEEAFPVRTWDRILGRRRKWFISHAYKDAGAIDVLRSEMAHYAEPVVFPAIEVSPREAVSTELLKSIHNCHGLIFIDSPASSASFWVNFERRYALRIGKEVLAFEPDRRTFSSHAARVGNCVAMLWNASIPEDHKLAHDIARWLHMERRVYTERLLQAPYEETYLGEYVVYSTPSTEYGEDEYSLRAKIREYGASVVVMVSNRTLLREWPFTYAGSILYHVEHGSMRKKPHVEYVWLERPSLPDLNRNPEKAPGAQTLFGDAVLRSAQSATCLVAAEDGTINWNRIDDLLIRLEHAAFERGLQDGPDREGIVRGRMLHQSYRRL